MKKITPLVLVVILSLFFLFPGGSQASTGGWEKVSYNGFGRGAGVFATYPLMKFQVYKDWLFAAGFADGDMVARAGLYKTDDGYHWERSGAFGFGEDNWALAPEVVYQDYLYVTATGAANGTQLWRTNDTVNWEKIVDDGFGNVNNIQSAAAVEFRGALYVSVDNLNSGTHIFKSYNGKDNWKLACQLGFGQPYENTQIISMEVFKDYLYATTFHQNGSAQIWRTKDGTTWEWVVGRGLGNPNNWAIWLSPELNGEMYAGTTSWTVNDNDLSSSLAELYKTSDGVHWAKVPWPENFNSKTYGAFPSLVDEGWLYLSLANDHRGGEVWRYDGKNWEQYADGGFGDHNNYATFVGARFHGYIYVGTANDNEGGEVWRKKIEKPAETPQVAGVSTTSTDLTSADILPKTGSNLIFLFNKFVDKFLGF